jgi:hypothetical protein
MSACAPAGPNLGRSGCTLLHQQGSSHRITVGAVIWEILALRSLCFLAIFPLFAHFAPSFREIHAQTVLAQLSPSSGLKQQRENEVPARPGWQTIPLPQIADRAEQLDHLLREISSQLMPQRELVELETRTEKRAAEIQRRILQTKELLSGEPTSLDLEEERRYWRSRSIEYADERRLLTMRAAKLEAQIQTLEAQQPEWVDTWSQIHQTPGIGAIVSRVKQQLDGIQAAISEVQEQLNVVLTVQNQVSQQDQQISDIFLRVRQARESERGHLLEPDVRPLWKARLEALDQNIGPPFRRSFTSAKEFLGSHKLATFTLAMVYPLALLGVLRLRRYVASSPEVSAEALQVLDHPFSVALLVTLIGTGQYIASAPIGIAFVFYLLYLVPVLRLLAPLTEAKLRVFLYVLALFYALGGAYLIIQLSPLFRRGLYALLVLAALVSFACESSSSGSARV